VFQRDHEDVHCRRILFGGSADNGYARLLGPLSENEAARERITLLAGPPFARELAEIKDRFRAVSFEKVFRSQKLQSPKNRAPSTMTPPRTPPVNYATAAGMDSSMSVPASKSVPATQQSTVVSKYPAMTLVLYNKAGQRVDEPVIYHQQDFASLMRRKLCNSFLLLGKCRYLDDYGRCVHDHDAKLSAVELKALRAVARQSPCSRKLSCEEPECLAGHRCTRKNCVRGDCMFSSEMHDVDIVPVS
jgi:hypothetical protein